MPTTAVNKPNISATTFNNSSTFLSMPFRLLFAAIRSKAITSRPKRTVMEPIIMIVLMSVDVSTFGTFDKSATEPTTVMSITARLPKAMATFSQPVNFPNPAITEI